MSTDKRFEKVQQNKKRKTDKFTKPFCRGAEQRRVTGYTIVCDKVADNQVDRMDHSASKVYRLVDSEVGTMMLLMIVS